MSLAELFSLLALGLFAGALGGLVGVGGSVVIIPFLTVVMGRNQHLSQAAAMIINVFVAAASVVRHHKADAVRWDVVVRMLPAGVVLILVGVEVSNGLHARILQQIYGAFLLYVIAFNIMKLIEERRTATEQVAVRVGWLPVSVTGGSMGFVAGLLGIGGAPVAIPLLQRVSHLPLRQAIASSSAVMVLTAIVGAVGKNLTLGQVVDSNGGMPTMHQSLLLAAGLAPTAVIGALIGAGLTHRIPVTWVRVAFTLLMIWASASMLGVI